MGICLGASIGALFRWWLGSTFNHADAPIMLGTWLANIVACWLMGIYLGSDNLMIGLPTPIRLAFITGFLGSLSTFSTLMAELHSYISLNDWLKMIATLNLHILTGIGSLILGRNLGIWIK